MESSPELRTALIATLTDAGVIRSAAVAAAFGAVPREDFVPEIAARRGLPAVYADVSLIVRERDGAPTSSSSQPWIMAEMLEALDVREGHRVLEIGLGTGYNAALLSRLVGGTGRVTSVDIDPDLGPTPPPRSRPVGTRWRRGWPTAGWLSMAARMTGSS